MGDYYGGRGGGGRGGHGGFKRRREEVQPMDPMRILLSNLMTFGDDTMPAPQVSEDAVSVLVKNVKREARTNPVAVRTMLIDCAVQLSAKVPLYSLIVGLVNVDEPAFAAEILAQVASDIETALKNPASYRKARLLLRFLAALIVPGVVQPASFLALLKSFIDAAIVAASSGAVSDEDGRTWQPFADQLVYMALIALPFGGSELPAAASDALNEVLTAADEYMEKRPRSTQPGLRPFSASVKEDDPLAESDNGGASFLSDVVAAVKEMVENGNWQLLSIPRVHQGLEVALASAPQTHAVTTPLFIPMSPPVNTPEGASDTLVGALVLQAFPPRGIIRFLDAEHTLSDRAVIERIIAEDYIIDMVAWWEADRVECAKQLARSVPLPYAYEPLLCEVLFSQMLRLPSPQYKPIMYSTLMVELCKLLKVFPRAMSACVRESFARINVMDPALRERLAEWLAYHLSNFEYLWPWTKWAHVLQAPAYDGQRRFCTAVMNRLVRLSYWDRVQAVLPEEFRVLLPPKPEVAALPAPEDIGAEAADAEGGWAAAALTLVRSKASAEDMDAWIAANDLETVLHGKIGVLRMLTRCLLVAGAKSYTHMIIALERYFGPLAVLSKETGLEGEIALVSATAETWALNPQRAVMAVDRLMTLRLVSAEAIISWVFGPHGVRCINDQSRSGMAWEMLRRAVHKTIARVEDATEELAEGEAAVEAPEGDVNAVAAVVKAQAILEKEAYLEETTVQQRAAVMQVLVSFAGALSPDGGFAGPDDDGGDGDGEAMVVEGNNDEDGGGGGGALNAGSSERTVLRDYIIASLRSFLREYHVQAAELEQQIEEEVPASQEVKDLVREVMRM